MRNVKLQLWDIKSELQDVNSQITEFILWWNQASIKKKSDVEIF